MKRLTIIFISMAFLSVHLYGDINELFAQADDYDTASDFQAEKKLLLEMKPEVRTSAQKAELYWRLSRAVLNIGDTLKKKGAKTDSVLKIFEEGEKYADMAIQYDPGNTRGYFWKSANMGMWGQTKGILDSLGKAEPMRKNLHKALLIDPDFADAYYVLGQLYEQVPGWPISFGYVEASVSLGRKAIDLHEKDIAAGRKDEVLYDYYIELARHLWGRNWDEGRRKHEMGIQRKRYYEKTDPVEKNFFYEGVLSISRESDREEAKKLLRWVVSEIRKISEKTQSQKNNLEKAEKLLKDYR